MNMHNSPVVSVVLPAYNAERFLTEAIESIRSQTFPDWELIVVDDCSRDGTNQIAKDFAAADPRIRVQRNDKNSGEAASRNNGIAAADPNSLFIATMDADDIALPERLAKQVAYLQENPQCAVVGSDLLVMDETGRDFARRIYPHSPEDVLKCFGRFNPMAHPSTLIRRSMLGMLRYSQEFVCVDYQLFFRLAEQYELANLTEPLIRYRISATQMKALRLKQTLRDTITLQKRYLWRKRFFSVINLGAFCMELLLYCLPGRVIFALFQWNYYRACGAPRR